MSRTVHRPPWSRTPQWLRERNRHRPPAFHDDVHALAGSDCAFCTALDAAHEPGGPAVVIDLAELERQHGECTCLGA